jgi:hypothetical protein
MPGHQLAIKPDQTGYGKIERPISLGRIREVNGSN